ncbi:MAG: hypothetical protein FJ088_07450, partial [Deltaproteobacteria bacterium]|nr:hypothetical protein [Deltaproteobacteria bacterium]
PVQPAEIEYPDLPKTEVINEDIISDIVVTKGDLCDSSNCAEKTFSGGECSIHSRAYSAGPPALSLLLLLFLAVIILKKSFCPVLK